MPSLREHQADALRFYRKNPRSLLLLPYGSGKTVPTVVRLAELCPPSRALVVTTTGTIYKWLRELVSWGRLDWRIANLTGKRAHRIEQFAKPHDVAVINYEGLRVMLKHLKNRFARHYTVQVYDEIHRVKRHDTIVSKTAAYMAHPDRADYVYGLTGSPVLENLTDLFPIFRVVRPELFGQDFDRWINVLFDKRGYRFVPKPGAEEYLTRKLHETSFTLPPELLDVSMPEQRFGDPWTMRLTGRTRTVYDRLEKELILALKHTRIPIEAIYTRMEKLCQIARGWVYDKRGRSIEISEPGIVELNHYMECISGQGRVVIWCVRDPDAAMVFKFLKRRNIHAGVVTGSTRSARKRDEIVRSFNSGNFQALIAHPRCIGEGEDLEAEYSFRYSYRWSAQEWDQSIGRFARMNSRARMVHYTDLVCEKTIDEGIIESIQSKQDLGRRVKKSRVLPWIRGILEELKK